jgi:hypothetical protein
MRVVSFLRSQKAFKVRPRRGNDDATIVTATLMMPVVMSLYYYNSF